MQRLPPGASVEPKGGFPGPGCAFPEGLGILRPVSQEEEPMSPQGPLEDGPKPGEAYTPEFHSPGDRLQAELKTSCKKFQLTELSKPVWVSQSEAQSYHYSRRPAFAL
jgi:hypothetical protein